jgi:D-glycero-D-manno-heptose 1,7-bisphosphate phosphatase
MPPHGIKIFIGAGMMQRLVILDRDGVINADLGRSVLSIAEFHLIPGAGQAIRALKAAGCTVVIATNQACVGRGEIDQAQLDAIHKHMLAQLAHDGATIDKVYCATDAGASPRKKPAPGMLLEALSDFNADPVKTVFLGDALRDLQAARAAGCIPALVCTGKGNETFTLLDEATRAPLWIYPDLPSFTNAYLRFIL